MKQTRRSFLLRSGLLVVAAGGVYALSSGLRDWLQGQIQDDFGPEIAQSSETSAFLDDYLVFLGQDKGRSAQIASVYFRLKPAALPSLFGAESEIRRHMLQIFARSTTTIMAAETGAEFQYAGLFEPSLAPCQNQLAAIAV